MPLPKISLALRGTFHQNVCSERVKIILVLDKVYSFYMMKKWFNFSFLFTKTFVVALIRKINFVIETIPMNTTFNFF